MNELIELLKKRRFSLSSEKVLQAEIEQHLINNSLGYLREYRLSEKSIIDFIVGGTGIEVKLSGSSKEIYRQCERYLQFGQVDRLILATNKILHLPKQINNKDTYVLNLGNAWL